jgi:RNA polymerase sigma factor (sigma-70 family)
VESSKSVTKGRHRLSERLTNFLRVFRRQVALEGAGEVTDADLLERFAHRRDEDAFTTLVHRHGPLVLGVCQRVLRPGPDAEDAFQATFLVLARKAGSIGQPERLGNWLYGVALRIAHKARAQAARRRARQQQVTDMPTSRHGGEADWQDLREVLDDEVERLPDKFRAPLVLCYMQGMTREEAAARLGWSAGAVKGMLERGRERLRSRLVRRGVTLSAGALAPMLSENALPAAVPVVLRDSTVKAAIAFAAGKATAAGSAAALAEGVLQAMFMYRVMRWLAVVLVLGLAGAGAGVLAFGGRPEEPVAPEQAGLAAKADEKADQPQRLAAARLDAAKTAYEGCWARYVEDIGPEDAVHLWSRRWLQAQLDLSEQKADHDVALASYQERLKKTDEIARSRLVLGNSPRFRHASGTPEDAKTEGEKFETSWKAYQESRASEEEVCLASIRWLMDQHQLRRIDKKIDPNAELQAHLDRVKEVEAMARVRFKAGKTALPEYKTATFFRVQAEEWLAQGKTFEAKDLTPGATSK